MEVNTILKVNDLHTYFKTEHGTVPSVNGVSFEVKEGETLAIVGESGSGKSVTSLSIMGLIDSPGKVEKGEILFEGKDLVRFKNSEYRRLRGNEIAMIFQEPLTSLNPLFTVGNQISEAIRLHQKVNKKIAKVKSIEMLRQVGIPRPEKVFSSYPHVLSGGMRQRVMIAMALSCNPKLLIADEPTTALDVTIQYEIINLIKELNRKRGTSVLLITHDLGVVSAACERTIVMYAGEVVESGKTADVLKRPVHPYTQSLLGALPDLADPAIPLQAISGEAPNLMKRPKGCAFAARCDKVMTKCLSEHPELTEENAHHQVACWLERTIV